MRKLEMGELRPAPPETHAPLRALRRPVGRRRPAPPVRRDRPTTPGRPDDAERRVAARLAAAGKLCSGAAWRDVPERYGPYRTVYDRFARYRDDGTLDRVLRALRVRLAADGHVDHSTWMVDGTTVRASRVAAGARKRGRRATKRLAARGAG